MKTGKISIVDLEVGCCVGVGEEERGKPQRLLLTLELQADFTEAAATDDLAHTIDYFAVAQRLKHFCAAGSWKLIEKLAADIADLVISEFRPGRVFVEVKKFIVPEARHVSVSLTKRAQARP